MKRGPVKKETSEKHILTIEPKWMYQNNIFPKCSAFVEVRRFSRIFSYIKVLPKKKLSVIHGPKRKRWSFLFISKTEEGNTSLYIFYISFQYTQNCLSRYCSDVFICYCCCCYRSKYLLDINHFVGCEIREEIILFCINHPEKMCCNTQFGKLVLMKIYWRVMETCISIKKNSRT